MALKVNLDFGGSITVTGNTVAEKFAHASSLLSKYHNLADNNNLVVPNNGTALMINAGEPLNFVFRYRKLNMGEAALQTFNDQWKALADANDIIRSQTTIEYFET